MIRAFVFALCFAPAIASAQTQLARLEALSVEMNDIILDLMIREVETMGASGDPLRAASPDSAWDDEYRAAGSCLLGRYENLVGAEGVNQMLDRMDAALPQLRAASMATASKIMALPDGVTQEQSLQINQDCGLIDISLKRMDESGFTKALMQALSNQ